MIKSGRYLVNKFASSKHYMDLEDQFGCHNYHPLEVVIAKASGVHAYDCEGTSHFMQARNTLTSFQHTLRSIRVTAIPRS